MIIFSDNIYALRSYAADLGRPFIDGSSTGKERLSALRKFRHNPTCNTLLLSKVRVLHRRHIGGYCTFLTHSLFVQIGDDSLDLPEASVIIQISSHGGSRRQEAQRLGRILRQHGTLRTMKGEYDAWFYRLVSRWTREVGYAERREQFLVDQVRGAAGSSVAVVLACVCVNVGWRIAGDCLRV